MYTSTTSRPQILVVDDEPGIRESLQILLKVSGYDPTMADNGLSALQQIKNSRPEIIISDLNMPQMSGFEFLSVVRRRFPEIPAIAMSGRYDVEAAVRAGAIADAFYFKGDMHPKDLLRMIEDVRGAGPCRAEYRQNNSPPVWVPQNGTDSHGKPYILMTCIGCLRSSPLPVPLRATPRVMETSCIFCHTEMQYIVDYSLPNLSTKKICSARFKSCA